MDTLVVWLSRFGKASIPSGDTPFTPSGFVTRKGKFGRRWIGIGKVLGGRQMGDWKASVSLRVPIPLRLELEEIAKREHRTLGNLGAILMEWAAAKLKEAGSIESLIHTKPPVPRNPNGNYKRGKREDSQQQR